MSGPVDLRILQANERTFLAWIRTGLALMAFGFVVARLALWLRLEVHHGTGGVSLWLGAVVIGVGAGCQAIGAIRFVAARRAILSSRPIEPGAVAPVVVALLVALVGVALLLHVMVQG